MWCKSGYPKYDILFCCISLSAITILTWENANKTDLQFIWTAHNKIIWNMSNCRRRDHVTPFYRQLGLLKSDDIHLLELAKFMYKYKKEMLLHIFDPYFKPIKDIHGHTMRTATRGNLYMQWFNKSKNKALNCGTNYQNVYLLFIQII